MAQLTQKYFVPFLCLVQAIALSSCRKVEDPVKAEDTGAADTSTGTETDTEILLQLVGAPLIFAPTSTGCRVNAVIAQGNIDQLTLSVLHPDDSPWQIVSDRVILGDDVAEWQIADLLPDRVYLYRLFAERPDAEPALLFEGEFVTAKSPGATFSFDLIADSHVFCLAGKSQVNESTYTGLGENGSLNSAQNPLIAVAANIAADLPDFLIHLGDVVDFHAFGFNKPPSDSSFTKATYLDYRAQVGDLLGLAAHFSVIGNWEGENGDYAEEEIDRSRSMRLLVLPGPPPKGRTSKAAVHIGITTRSTGGTPCSSCST